jgi:phosphoribosylcarboxyaminoimidazole (NCAIR) mutase
VEILAVGDAALSAKMKEYREKLAKEVDEKAARVQAQI